MRSIWEATVEPLHRPVLASNETADVCVIGAGIAGLSVAYRLARVGRSVIVLDRQGIGEGMTARTTAHLTAAFDDRYYYLEQTQGIEVATGIAQSHSLAVGEIAEIVEKEKIDCNFERVDGYLFSPPNGSLDLLREEYEATLRAGLMVEWVEDKPVLNSGPAIRFPHQAQFHPLKYLHGLVKAIERLGGRVYSNSPVHKIFGEGTVEVAANIIVKCGVTVIATNAPIFDRFHISPKQAPYTTYAVALEIAKDRIPHVLWWDTAETARQEKWHGPAPYHYVRVHPGEEFDYLIVGGEDHKTGQKYDRGDPFEKLATWARERFPSVGPVCFQWSGQVMEPMDGVPFIGRYPGERNMYVATGDSGNGMTAGVVAGELISDLILGKENSWVEIYNPARIRFSATGEWLKENMNAMAQMRDYITTGDVFREEQIKPGEGAIVRHGLTKIAVYRDEEGTLHHMSAVCPHLGCLVRWDEIEKTWDCPCHGSRFDACGHVINGPALSGLKEAE